MVVEVVTFSNRIRDSQVRRVLVTLERIVAMGCSEDGLHLPSISLVGHHLAEDAVRLG